MGHRRRFGLAVLASVALATACNDTDTTAPTDTGTATTTLDVGTTGAIATPDTPDTTAVPTTSVPTTAALTTVAAPPSTATPTTPAPPPATTIPVDPNAVPAVEAAAYAVYDGRTGTMLASSQADVPLPVASLMKLLVAQTAYAAGAPTKIVIAPPGLLIDDAESRIGITEGQELPRDLLIRAMLIVSANDAARLLALDIAGGEAQFAELMNQQAANLGLTNTHAVNASGLDQDGQYSTADDMTRLAVFLMNNATFQLTVKRTDATLNGQLYPASNDLLTKYPGADGVKTGHTTQAGWCIVASALRDGRRIFVTVLGAPTEAARDAAATNLLDWGFAQP